MISFSCAIEENLDDGIIIGRKKNVEKIYQREKLSLKGNLI